MCYYLLSSSLSIGPKKHKGTQRNKFVVAQNLCLSMFVPFVFLGEENRQRNIKEPDGPRRALPGLPGWLRGLGRAVGRSGGSGCFSGYPATSDADIPRLGPRPVLARARCWPAHLSSNAVTSVFRCFGGGVRPEIGDFGPLPGPARPREGPGKALAGAPVDLHRFSARHSVTFVGPSCDCMGVSIDAPKLVPDSGLGQ